MSPEQARGKQLDTRTDLFSFGAVLYEMATGTLALPRRHAGVVFEAILNRVPGGARCGLNPGDSVKLEEIIYRLLEKDRELRYQGAAEVRADLKRLKRDSDPRRSAATHNVPVTPLRADAIGQTGQVCFARWRWLAAVIAGGAFLYAEARARDSRRKMPSC